jgi:dienelactone hydrolase
MRHLLRSSIAILFNAYRRNAVAPTDGRRDAFRSAGRWVRVERFEPAGAAPCPAVVLLHGLDGLEGGGDTVYRPLARRLAARGYVVVLVRYLDRTGTTNEELSGLLSRFTRYLDGGNPDAEEWQDLRALFASWQTCVADAVDYVRRLSRVDSDRVGLAGVSMGGFLACAAARDGLDVRCVAELFGGLPGHLAAGLRKMPPTLILHGDRDDVVPVRHAHALRHLLAARGLPCEAKVYRGVGHCFEQPGKGRICWLSALDAERRAANFLAEHLSSRRLERRPLLPLAA